MTTPVSRVVLLFAKQSLVQSNQTAHWSEQRQYHQRTTPVAIVGGAEQKKVKNGYSSRSSLMTKKRPGALCDMTRLVGYDAPAEVMVPCGC